MNYKVRGNTKQQSFAASAENMFFSLYGGKTKRTKRKKIVQTLLCDTSFTNPKDPMFEETHCKRSPPKKGKKKMVAWKREECCQECQCDTETFLTTASSSAFQSTGLTTISSRNINTCRKYYWQPWLSGGADVSGALLHKWGGFFPFSFFQNDTTVSALHATDSIIK